MAKKGKSQTAEAGKPQTSQATPSRAPSLPAQPSSSTPPNPWFGNGSKAKNGEPSTSALIICRNKHWRYISSFHGPWLQLPPEVLESLAHGNYLAPRPHPVDPAVFYDLVKIRKAVDEATNIAVRAASGVTSASLNASLSANNGMLNSAGAAALGLGFGGSGGSAKLSRERKHRMRELATQKLSQAYHLDEIAASVATMQSASTLEDLAQHVLQRNNMDYDARYVHFFHEKIPSRQMAEYTPLDVLDSLIVERPSDGSTFRTRALTRIFKDDFVGASKDLTEGLALSKWLASQHKAGRDQLVLASEAAKQRGGRDWRDQVQIAEEDQPSSLEPQLLFHRANVHLALACSHVHEALDAFWDEEDAKKAALEGGDDAATSDTARTNEERVAHKRHLELRRLVKSNARKAQKDYMEFLKHFDYTPGIPTDLAEDFVRRVHAAQDESGPRHANGITHATATRRADFDEEDDDALDAQLGALVRSKAAQDVRADLPQNTWPTLPEIYPASQLFSEKIPSSIPPYPNSENALAIRNGPALGQSKASDVAAAALADCNESITYHPLLTDALHSLLLCHALLQTSPTELKRHAHNAARLARICDGYPIFLAARSPARADWVEILRRAHNWIGLTSSWETLCRPAPLPGHGNQGQGDRGWNLGKDNATTTSGGSSSPVTKTPKSEKELEKVRKEKRKQEAILEALADDRVVDEESFQRAVRAREKRAEEDEELAEMAKKGELRHQQAAAFPTPPQSVLEDEKPVNEDTETQTLSTPEPPASPLPTSPSPNGSQATTRSEPRLTAARDPVNKSNAVTAKRWAQDDSKDYPISTERAEAISRWIREAPLTVEGAKKKSGKSAGRKRASGVKQGVEKGVAGLALGGDVAEEEVD